MSITDRYLDERHPALQQTLKTSIEIVATQLHIVKSTQTNVIIVTKRAFLRLLKRDIPI